MNEFLLIHKKCSHICSATVFQGYMDDINPTVDTDIARYSHF